MTPSLAAIAKGDFSGYLPHFVQAGYVVSDVAQGIVQIVRNPSLPSVLLSIGVHGDETAPIELVAQLLDVMAAKPDQLAVNLMLVVGDPLAIAQARRFVEADLNRLFCSDQGDIATTMEAARARDIMSASRAFFSAMRGPRWHLDLHTSIRASLYPLFAIVPDVIVQPRKRALVQLLSSAGIEAIILNRSAVSTFCAFTAENLGATSATLELGQISALGSNDMTHFADAMTTLAALLRGETTLAALAAASKPAPIIFQLAREIIKTTDDFALSFGCSTPNFTPFAPGCIIATDGALVHRVGSCEEHVVFPNPSVQIGQRAALMVIRGTVH
jgi:succinylglutamate desuccinylase